MVSPRRVVSRACAVCDWQATTVEVGDLTVDCPLCHAPTRITGEDVLDAAPGGPNPHAAALGRLGGLKGGPARAQRLSAKRRREIARKAAEARWRRRR